MYRVANWVPVIAGSIAAVAALITAWRATAEYKAQGRQRRAEFFLRMMDRFLADESFLEILELLRRRDEDGLARIERTRCIQYLGFIEEVALLVNSGLVPNGVAGYMFGSVPIQASESPAFMRDITPGSPGWTLFFDFVAKMKECQASHRENAGRLQL